MRDNYPQMNLNFGFHDREYRRALATITYFSDDGTILEMGSAIQAAVNEPGNELFHCAFYGMVDQRMIQHGPNASEDTFWEEFDNTVEELQIRGWRVYIVGGAIRFLKSNAAAG